MQLYHQTSDELKRELLVCSWKSLGEGPRGNGMGGEGRDEKAKAAWAAKTEAVAVVVTVAVTVAVAYMGAISSTPSPAHHINVHMRHYFPQCYRDKPLASFSVQIPPQYRSGTNSRTFAATKLAEEMQPEQTRRQASLGLRWLAVRPCKKAAPACGTARQ
jgi:hypothetical protein